MLLSNFSALNRGYQMMRLLSGRSPILLGKNILSHDVVYYLIKALENADASLSSDIENDLVRIGKKSIMPCIEALKNPNQKVRKHAAMALIRIGVDSIEPLSVTKASSPEMEWAVEYIVSEILGSQQALSQQNLAQPLAC
jgi:hypothetical protein